MDVECGFLVVKRFEALYREFAAKPKFDRSIYALPVFGTGPERVAVKYRGLDRDAVDGRDKGTLAQIHLHELEEAGVIKEFVGLLPDAKHAADVLGWAEMEFPDTYEIVWARIAGTFAGPPEGFACLGLEPSYFVSDHFSPICDCMCFPRWHGTDPEGALFRDHFERLNHNGLFDSATHAQEFLTYYLSFDWTETGDYEIAEVWAPEK